MAPVRRKESNRNPKTNTQSKNVVSSPGNRRSKRKTTATKTLASENKLSIGSPKTSQTTLKDYYENFFRTDIPQPEELPSNKKRNESPDRNTPSPISVEEMCVKMTLDEFHYNTNIIELIKEYWLQQNHPEKLLQKMMNNLDFYIERVYNRYISKPKFRHDKLFKKLKILPVSIDIKDAEDSDSKYAHIQRNRKNKKDENRKRKADAKRSSSESEPSYKYISDDTSCEETNLKSVNLANKKRKLTKSQTAGRRRHSNKGRFEDPMTNDGEILNKETQLGKRLRRCPSPQEGCSKWLYKSVPSENSFGNHLDETDRTINVQSSNKISNPKRYADNISPTQIEEICSYMSLKEFKEETNIIDIIKERTTPSSNSAAKVDSYAERIYNQCIKNKYKRRHDLFVDLKITEKAVELYARHSILTKPTILHKPTQDLFDANSVKDAPCPISKKRKHNIAIAEPLDNQIVKQELAKQNFMTDRNKIVGKDTMVVIPFANLRDSNILEPSKIEELTQLNKQGILMTKKPCPLSKKMKYVLGAKPIKSSQEKFNGNQHQIVGEDNADIIPDNFSASNSTECQISSKCTKGPFSKTISADASKTLNQKNISYTDTNTRTHDNQNGMNIQNINDLPRDPICRLAEVKTTIMESQKLHGAASVETLSSSVAQNEPSNIQPINTKSSLHSSSTTLSTTLNDENLTVILVENESAVSAEKEYADTSKLANVCAGSENESVETPIKVEAHNISNYSDEIEFLPTKDQSIISITDELTNTEAMLNEIFMPTDVTYPSITTGYSRNYFPIQNETNDVNKIVLPAIPNESPLTSNIDQVNDNVITSSGSSSEVPPSPEVQDNNSSVRTTNPVEDTQKSSAENAKLPTILSCVSLPNLNRAMKRNNLKSFKRKSPSKFSPLEFLANTQTFMSVKPKTRKMIDIQVSDEICSLEDLIEEEISQEVVDNSQMIETNAALQTNSQLLNADLTYLQNARFPSPTKEVVISASANTSKNKPEDLPKSDKTCLAPLLHNVEITATLNRPLRHKNFTCLTCLDIRRVVFGEHVNRLNYESNSPFLEKSKDKQVRATIKVNLGRCRSLHIVGETLQILLGLTNKEWQCVMKLFDVIERFEFQSTDPEPTNKSLPYRILYYLFKTLPKFSQATIQSVTTGSDDQVSCVTMNINYFKPIQSLKQAFQPIILDKLKAYNASLRTG